MGPGQMEDVHSEYRGDNFTPGQVSTEAGSPRCLHTQPQDPGVEGQGSPAGAMRRARVLFLRGPRGQEAPSGGGGAHLLAVGCDHADVLRGHLAAEAPGQEAAVAHDLHGLGRVEPGRAPPFPRFAALSGWETRETGRHEASFTSYTR